MVAAIKAALANVAQINDGLNPMLLYLHGFESSPASPKILATEQHLQLQNRASLLRAPQQPAKMSENLRYLNALIGKIDEPIAVMGSSLGGFWAHYVVSQLQLRGVEARAVLINPAVSPAQWMPRETEQRIHPYTAERYQLDDSDRVALLKAEQALSEQVELLVLLQQGDETLDFRDARTRYRHQRMIVEASGDHSFVNFSRYLPMTLEFLRVL